VPDGGPLRIAIRDNGRGFGSDALGRLFEPDYTTKPRGTGLGLTIAKQTIEAHGGRIIAGDVDGGGAEIVIELPGLEAEDRSIA
jgi:signal transduction histidine kinase